MRILVVGSGAREHALCQRLSQDPGVERLTCAPGNPGIARTVEVAALDVSNPDAVLTLARTLDADLTIIGPEGPLAAGVADRFAHAGQPLFGPTRAAAQLETSKAFAKNFMARHRVPTAHYLVCTTAAQALAAIRSGAFGDTLVVKADGLAAGKGVVVAPDRATAEAAVLAAMVDHTFGTAGARVVLEECLTGPEVSFFVVADGENYVPLPSAQDHKRIYNGDAGPNTGGMGAFAPSPLVDAALDARIRGEIVEPVLRGMASEGTPFRGFLYCGVMLTPDGPRVIEFNVRFGDPEAQVVLPLLDTPLAPLLMAAAKGELALWPVGERSSHALPAAVGLVLAAAGYPGPVQTGDVIHGLDVVARNHPDVSVCFAGVNERDGMLVTAGGRVLTLVARGAGFKDAMSRVYAAAANVRFDGMQYRTDIGLKAINPVAPATGS